MNSSYGRLLLIDGSMSGHEMEGERPESYILEATMYTCPAPSYAKTQSRIFYEVFASNAHHN